ncbi:MAG: spermidine synthase [Gemmatimonadales bacterium]
MRLTIMVTALLMAGIGAAGVLVGSGLVGGGAWVDASPSLLWLGLLLLVVGGAAAWTLLHRASVARAETRWLERLTNALVAWNVRDDALTESRRKVALVLVSVLGLFFELVLIRLLGSEVKVFAFLKNVVLLGAFLGLGLGFFIARRPAGLLPLFLPGAAVLAGSVILGAKAGLLTSTILPGGDELVLLGLSFLEARAVSVALRLLMWIPYYAITLGYFLAVVLVFIPLGQYTGKCMRAFAPISAYSLNLAGALAGTLLFALVSFAWLPPVAWFGLTALLALLLVLQPGGHPEPPTALRWLRQLNLVAALGLVLVQGLPGRVLWSPYNKLVAKELNLRDRNGKEVRWGYQLGVGEYYYQDMANLSAGFFDAHPDLPLAYRFSEYEVPYAFARPAQVLILGAGTGNDVAAALRHGAEHVDAVDIDPGIIEFGKRLHPEQPYASARVTAHANDARAFLKSSHVPYDLVLFGLLDSQQVLSAFGSVRLDNFVYTVEGMRDAFARVKPDGLLVVTFELFRPWIGERIAGVMRAATGQTPLILHAHHGTVFIVRKGASFSAAELENGLAVLGGAVKPLAIEPTGTRVTTDDWPYLYMLARTLPFAYWTILPLLALVATRLARSVLGTGWRIQGRFFWLGAAFMLMEVRIIAQVALLFGSTWLVNAAAISAVLLMAILANLLVARMGVTSIRPWAALLLLTLAISSATPTTVFLGLGQVAGGIAGALLLALPILFAGMVFSASLRGVPGVDTAMASNLMGAILGGLIEYVSLMLGIGSLAWVAAALYSLAVLARVPDSPAVPSSAARAES